MSLFCLFACLPKIFCVSEHCNFECFPSSQYFLSSLERQRAILGSRQVCWSALPDWSRTFDCLCVAAAAPATSTVYEIFSFVCSVGAACKHPGKTLRHHMRPSNAATCAVCSFPMGAGVCDSWEILCARAALEAGREEAMWPPVPPSPPLLSHKTKFALGAGAVRHICSVWRDHAVGEMSMRLPGIAPKLCSVSSACRVLLHIMLITSGSQLLSQEVPPSPPEPPPGSTNKPRSGVWRRG